VQKFVVYRRVSTKRQGESGLGLDAQDRDIDLFLNSYAEVPFEVVATFTDVLSGATADRPELARALDMARKEGATLLVAKLDRLSRNVAFVAALLDDRRLNVRVASMPHADKFQLHIYAALAEQEREFISLRTKAALAVAKARGQKLGGLRDSTAARNAAMRIQADDHAQKVASTITARRAAGATYAQIADDLNSMKVPTARGGQWHPTTVRNAEQRLTA